MDNSFDYVAVLVSIIVGLGVTRVLTGLSDIIQAGNRRQAYWIHTAWMINTFIFLILLWWVFYRWKSAPQWNFFLFLWVTIAPTLVYLASGVLCPGELRNTGAQNWREYYYANCRSFFFIIAPIWALDLIDTLLKGREHFANQGPLYLPTMAVWCFGSLAAGITKNERYHAFWAIALPLCQIAYTTHMLLRLG